ncbi:MAG: DNA polymerase III subunit chi [Limimaricola sp.]|uniref:DNA polymerase III subunit chi n=1 Tax=Limimaricola sp. TaxID=2211665 RepID=UPI001DDAC8E1|nr:DNA polymerase III subunit chi [Limimaricola sp.]MBI1418286.1 DNA polymerase III subunit chi [Limimaricola sp.]
MGAAFFYHLTEASAAQTLAMLLPKALAAGWRVEVRGTDPARIEALDIALWQGPDEGFLPHGLAGGPHDAAQPVLLCAGQPAANDPTCLMAVDGAEVDPAEAARAERVCILFDGQDEGAVAAARGQWKQLTDAGLPAQYWAQEGGRWAMKAQKGDANG